MLARKLNFNSKLLIPINIEDKSDLVLRPKDMSLSNKKIELFTKSKIKPILSQLNDLL